MFPATAAQRNVRITGRRKCSLFQFPVCPRIGEATQPDGKFSQVARLAEDKQQRMKLTGKEAETQHLGLSAQLIENAENVLRVREFLHTFLSGFARYGQDPHFHPLTACTFSVTSAMTPPISFRRVPTARVMRFCVCPISYWGATE